MIRRLLMLAALAPATPIVAQRNTTSPNARSIIDSAIATMSGSTDLAGLSSLRFDGRQHEYLLGNAERAEGPWRVMYGQYSELRDLRGMRIRRYEALSIPGLPAVAERTAVLADSVTTNRLGGRETAGSPSGYEDLLERMESSPERALLLARQAPALRLERQVIHFGVPHDVVAFPWRGGTMRIEVSRESRLPSFIETVRHHPDDFRRAPFGDVTLRTEYVNWTAEPSGFWWPRQQITRLNGQPLRDVTVANLTLDAPISADSFAVADSVRVQYAAGVAQSVRNFRFGSRGAPTELAPDVVRLRDFWTQTLVKQDDGVIIFEAHLSGDYLDQVIAEANRRWPSAPIKGIVMTSDPWAHVGGVRQAVARGIPIYASARSIPFLTSLVRAPHTIAPDLLQKAPRAPKFIPIDGKRVIGTGRNRIELYPVGGPYAERMLMAYFPEQKLLYGADLVFANRGAGGYLRTPALDLKRAVQRNGLVVDSLFCVQPTPVIAWKDF